jgi:hypothetical protein
MRAETAEKIQSLVDRVWKYFCSISGVANYDVSIKALRENARQYPSFAVWAHQWARENYPMPQLDTIQPENFAEILELIDSREKFGAVTSQLPEEAAPEIKKFLEWMLKECLPSMRADAQSLVKHLPQRRRGGRPIIMPGPAKCRQICKDISKLHESGVALGLAQRRISTREELSLRMIERIWAARKLKGSGRVSRGRKKPER